MRGSIAILSYFIWAGTLGALAYYAITKLWPWIVDGGLFAWNLLKL